MNETCVFNRITFALPIETYRVDAFITSDERLPVVTEYVLRLLRICEKISLCGLRDYFGFTDAEALAVVESLERQGLVQVTDDYLGLSGFAIERFEQSSEDYPRFTKVEERRDNVTFDLVSFSPLQYKNHTMLTDNWIRLNASEESIGNSLELAKRAYFKRFPEIVRMNEDLKKKAIDLYSVEDIQTKKRGYLAIPVNFSLNEQGQVERKADSAFENGASRELVDAFHESVSNFIPVSQKADLSHLDIFMDFFDLTWMSAYITGKLFNFRKFAADVQTGAISMPKGTSPLFGNIYLTENAQSIAQKIKSRRKEAKYNKLHSSIAWLVPDDPLWGRGDALQTAIGRISLELKDGNHDELHLFAAAETGAEQAVTNHFRGPEIKNLHLYRPTDSVDYSMGGRLELLIYPPGFVVAMFHLSIPGDSTLRAPVGIISSRAKDVKNARQVILELAAEQRYLGKANFGKQVARTSEQPSLLAECGFICYSDLLIKPS